MLAILVHASAYFVRTVCHSSGYHIIATFADTLKH